MAKPTPKLKLVREGSTKATAFSAALNYVSFTALNVLEKEQVRRLVDLAAPGAGIVSVVKCKHTWDLRPVVSIPGAAELRVIRSFGPNISANEELSEKILRAFSQFRSVTSLEAGTTVSWGRDAEASLLWYSRPMFEETLAHQLSEDRGWEFSEVFEIVRSLCEQILALHGQGVVHGHIVSSNVVIREKQTELVDPFFAAQVVDADTQEESVRATTLAPEIQRFGEISEAADAYGFSQLSRRLLLKARQSYFQGTVASVDNEAALLSKIDLLREALLPYASERPELRPALGKFLLELEKLDPNAERKNSNRAKREKVKTTIIAEKKETVLEPQVQELVEVDLVTSAEKPESRVSSISQDWWLYVICAACLVFCVYSLQQYFSVSSSVDEFSVPELKLAWESQVPSQMQPVALAASQGDERSRSVILRSVLSKTRLPKIVNVPLLAGAFDTRWESRLSDVDRDVAFSFGLASLTAEDLSVLSTEELAKVHPGVLLSIVAFGRDRSSLSQIPFTRLAKIQGNIGRAFQALGAGENFTTVATPEAALLAEFALGGVKGDAKLLSLLEQHFGRRILALALLFGNAPTQADAILGTLLRHPNLSIQNSFTAWAKRWELESWSGFKSGEKLQILAGVLPNSNIDSEAVVMMLNHPVALLRGEAAKLSIDKIPFAHPASVDVLNEVSRRPASIGADSMLPLVQLLENPSKVIAGERQFAGNAYPSWLLEMLVAQRGKSTAKEVAFQESLFLELKDRSDWTPEKAKLEQFAQHASEYIRLAAFTKLYQSKIASADYFKTAARKEKSASLKAHLKELGSLLP